MRKSIKLFLTFSLLFTLFVVRVNAECSYQERKELLSEAKNVDAFFEVDLDNNKFIFNLYNLSDNLFVELVNLSNNESEKIYKYQQDNDYYSFDIDNVSDYITYRLYIKSNKSECYSDSLTSKTLIKGIINKYYKEDVCKDIEDYIYCKPVLTKKTNYSDDEIYEKIKKYKEDYELSISNNKKEEYILITFLKNYWKYVLLIAVVLLIIILLLIRFNKKRGELEWK